MEPFEFIKQKIYDIGWIDPFEPVLPESDIEHDLNLDGIEFVELLMQCEKQYNIYLPDEESKKVKTVQDLVNLVEKYINIKSESKK